MVSSTKIAHLVSIKKGLPVFLYREVKLLRELGNDVHLFVMRNGNGVAMPEPDWPIVTIKIGQFLLGHVTAFITCPANYLTGLVEAVREKCIPHFAEAVYFAPIMRKAGISVIYCCEGTHALWIAYFAKQWYDVPIVVTVHAEMITNADRLNITKKAGHLSDRILTDTDFNRQKLIEKFDLPEEKVEVSRLWSPYAPDDRIKILIVGEWSERKGHEVLLDAFEQLDSASYVLWVVGGGTWSGEYYDVAAEAKHRGLTQNVVLWGKVSDDMLKVLYQSCDIYTQPSRTTQKGITEGLPVSLMEAMSFGKPVVATRHVGIPELVEEMLVDENSSDQLMEAFEYLGADEKRRNEQGRRNREIIQERYSEKNIEFIASRLQQAGCHSIPTLRN